MSENLNTALELLGVGMLTVFIVLFLVVFIGNMIVLFVNRYVPEEIKAAPKPKPVLSTQTTIDANKMAAIVSAVQMVTEGKGRVVNVEKA